MLTSSRNNETNINRIMIFSECENKKKLTIASKKTPCFQMALRRRQEQGLRSS